MRISEHCSLLGHNTFGIAARARRLVEYETTEELQAFIRQRSEQLDHTPLLHIGGGSNLLFTKDFEGTILHSRIQGIELLSDADRKVEVRVGAAVVWDDLVAYAVRHGWYGLENLSLIPGEVGASAVQNIGAYGAEAKDFISLVETIDLQTGTPRQFTNDECQYAYRHSIFKTRLRDRYAVTHVRFRLSRDFEPNLEYGGLRLALSKNGIDPNQLDATLLRATIIGIREGKLPDPKVLGNAGSFFTNPIVLRNEYDRIASEFPEVPHYEVDALHVKIPAAWLIEQCGWKGKALGRAGVYEKQALVLVNLGGATGAEIVQLCRAIQTSVRERFQIDIQPEVNFI